jgi:ubiquinone/menaquinone biosynthesis C-methylase UbiE
LSKDSARIYDFQVEILFTGAADAMRRQALVPLYHCLKRRDQRKLKLLDVACGTGGLLSFVKDNYPRLSTTGVDLSPDYLREAQHCLEAWCGVDLVRSNAESMPFHDETYDVVTCSYLFHELPPRVRSTVAGEMGRLLKPGGTLIFVETLQIGDRPEFDALLEMFPVSFHEPYYASYIARDVKALFKDTPLTHKEDAIAFLSKVSVFEKL